jgi:hypothetical protein
MSLRGGLDNGSQPTETFHEVWRMQVLGCWLNDSGRRKNQPTQGGVEVHDVRGGALRLSAARLLWLWCPARALLMLASVWPGDIPSLSSTPSRTRV